MNFLTISLNSRIQSTGRDVPLSMCVSVCVYPCHEIFFQFFFFTPHPLFSPLPFCLAIFSDIVLVMVLLYAHFLYAGVSIKKLKC